MVNHLFRLGPSTNHGYVGHYQMVPKTSRFLQEPQEVFIRRRHWWQRNSTPWIRWIIHICEPWCWYIETYKTGWFCSGSHVGVHIPAPWFAYGIAEDWLYPSSRDQDFRAGFFLQQGMLQTMSTGRWSRGGVVKEQTRAVTRCESL